MACAAVCTSSAAWHDMAWHGMPLPLQTIRPQMKSIEALAAAAHQAASTALGTYPLGISAGSVFFSPVGVARAASTHACASAASAACMRSNGDRVGEAHLDATGSTLAYPSVVPVAAAPARMNRRA